MPKLLYIFKATKKMIKETSNEHLKLIHSAVATNELGWAQPGLETPT